MQGTLSKLIPLLTNGFLEIESFDMSEQKTETQHEIRHSYKEEIIIPTVALTNTFDFFMFPRAKKVVRMADGTMCEVSWYEEKHICEFEDDIKRLYNMEAWDFIKKWYKADFMMTNMMFVKIVFKKV